MKTDFQESVFLWGEEVIIGLGVDIVEISRMKKALENPRFIQRVFTEGEQVYCRSRGASAAASFAARWAGKEAVLKAFGTGLRQGQLRELEILPDELGCPQLRLWGYFAELASQRGIDSMLISLSHAREYAIAQCILGRNSDEDSNR